MRKNQVKLMVAGMLVMVLMTGCGSSDNNADSGSNSIISTDMEDAGHNAEEQESLADTETAQMGESSQPQSQSQVAESIEEELAAYRAEREKEYLLAEAIRWWNFRMRRTISTVLVTVAATHPDLTPRN